MTDAGLIATFAATFVAGLGVGHYVNEVKWRGYARSPARHESGGKLYHVVEDTDARKARAVAQWCGNLDVRDATDEAKP